MDRFTSLSVFVVAVELGSLAAASRRLGMTPAMAGKHLAATEASLGVRLLHRTTRRLRPTEAGQDYYRRCRTILDALDDADRAVRELQDEPRGVLRVAAPSAFGALHLGRPVAAFLRRYPALSLELSLSDRVVDLLADGFDMAIRIGALPDSTLVARRFAHTTMLACASPSYLDRMGRARSPRDLRRFDRLAFSLASSPTDWSFTDRNGRTHRVHGSARILADDVRLLLGAALDGAGIVYGPDFVLGEPLASGALERVLPDYANGSLGIHAVYPSARLVGAKVRCFVDWLDRWFGAIPPWGGGPPGEAAAHRPAGSPEPSPSRSVRPGSIGGGAGVR